jgi:hypothetical protein
MFSQSLLHQHVRGRLRVMKRSHDKDREGLPHSSLNKTVKQFSHKLHKNGKIEMTNIFPSKSEYNHIIIQVNLHAFHILISV